MKKILYFIAVSLLVACGAATKPGESRVRMHTTAGVIELRLYDETPKHKENFLKLVNEHRFDSLLFHRVIKDFMIQGGDPTSKNAAPGAMLGEGDLGYKVDAEFLPEKYFHRRGALAAAREGDYTNPEKASSASQFYIVWGVKFTPEQLQSYKSNYKSHTGKELVLTPEQERVYTTIGGTPHLDGEYTVFGEVTQGLDVVEKIQNMACDRYDRPLEDVRILNVEIID